MTLRLDDTNAGAVAAAIQSERHRIGATASGMVMTLVIVADEENQSEAMQAAQYSAGEHPCRILITIPRPSRGAPKLDASISVGDTEGPGEVVRMRLRGPLAHQAESVVLPLLLSDTPVVVWWPAKHPDDPSADPLGRLANRRIIDTLTDRRFTKALTTQKQFLTSGDTDLAWTRLTPWRAALAATLDQPYDPIVAATIFSQPIPSAPLLRTWLEWRLKVPVSYVRSRGPAINQVVLHTTNGDIRITRPDGHMATVERNGVAVKELFLPRRELRDLLAEELRRLDPDDTYEMTMSLLDVDRLDPDSARAAKQAVSSGLASQGKTGRGAAKKASASRTTKKATAKKSTSTRKRSAAKPSAAKKA